MLVVKDESSEDDKVKRETIIMTTFSLRRPRVILSERYYRCQLDFNFSLCCMCARESILIRLDSALLGHEELKKKETMLTFPISQSQSSQARARQPSTCDREQFCRHEKNKLHDAVVCHRCNVHKSLVSLKFEVRELRLLFCSFLRALGTCQSFSRVSSSFGGCWLLFTSSQFSIPAAVALDLVWRLSGGSNDSHCTRRLLQLNASKVRIAGTRMKIKERKKSTNMKRVAIRTRVFIEQIA